jgi:hypothetical protein
MQFKPHRRDNECPSQHSANVVKEIISVYTKNCTKHIDKAGNTYTKIVLKVK